MEWKTVTAEQFCTRVTDGTHNSPKRQEVGRYLITSKHLSGSDIDFSSAYKISEEDYQKIIVRSNVEQYDILFSMIGTIGNTYRVTEEAVDYAVKNMAIFKFGGNKGDSSWFYYWLKSPQAQAYISQMQAGSTQGYLTLATLRSFPVAVPDHATQDKIVAILSSLDDKIENNNRINRNLEAQAQALFKSWFVDFEPWGGTMPEDWKEGTLGEFLIESKEKVGNRVVEEYSVGKQGIRKRSEIYHKQITSTPALNKLLKKGQIVFGMGSGSVDWGVMTDEIGATSPAYTIYNVSSLIPTDYFKRFFEIKHAKALDLVKPSVRQGQGLDKGVLLSKYIYIPTEEVWTDFVKIYEPLHTKIANNQKESARLATLRDTLLPKLMRGEIEV